MIKKLANLYYSFVYEVVLVPFLALSTYMMYQRLVYTNIVYGNTLLFFLVLAFLVLFNITLVYLIVYIYIKVYKVNLYTYTLIGSLGIGFVLCIKIFWLFMERTNCMEPATDKCADAIINNQASTFIMVVVIFYFLTYFIFHKMISKKINLEKLALKNEKSKKSM